MSEALRRRIEEIRDAIESAGPAERAEMLEHLEQAVAQLEAKGEQTPSWVRQRLADRIDEDVEDQFDNMPL